MFQKLNSLLGGFWFKFVVVPVVGLFSFAIIYSESVQMQQAKASIESGGPEARKLEHRELAAQMEEIREDLHRLEKKLDAVLGD